MNTKLAARHPSIPRRLGLARLQAPCRLDTSETSPCRAAVSICSSPDCRCGCRDRSFHEATTGANVRPLRVDPRLGERFDQRKTDYVDPASEDIAYRQTADRTALDALCSCH